MKFFKLSQYISLIISVVCCSCVSTKEESDTSCEKETTVAFPSDNTGKASDILDSISFIPIYESDDALISTVSKLMIFDNHIFILDRFAKNTLAVFDEHGNFIRHYGNKGEGGAEYRRAWDFDVDSKGVYVYDLHGKKIMIFTRDGEHVGNQNVDNRLQGFAKIDNGYILGLAKDEDNTANELLVVDSSLNIVNTYLPFRDSFKDDRMVDNLFRKNDSTIVYNRPISNSLCIFDRKGILSEKINIKFNNSDIPKELTDSYEVFLKENGKEKYNYVYDSPIYDGNYIICPIFINGQKGTAIYDVHNEYFYVKEMDPMSGNVSLTDIILPMSYHNKKIYTILEQPITNVLADKDSLPTDIINHLNDGNKVICIYHLK